MSVEQLQARIKELEALLAAERSAKAPEAAARYYF